MLSFDDDPTIRFAIHRRLDHERGVKICEIKIAPHRKDKPPFIAVGVLTELDNSLVLRSVFHLPGEFDIAHLRNEIDQIAEQYKAARKEYFGRVFAGQVMMTPERQLLGTGLRGLWAQHG